jgi:hypothetical protein
VAVHIATMLKSAHPAALRNGETATKPQQKTLPPKHSLIALAMVKADTAAIDSKPARDAVLRPWLPIFSLRGGFLFCLVFHLTRNNIKRIIFDRTYALLNINSQEAVFQNEDSRHKEQ